MSSKFQERLQASLKKRGGGSQSAGGRAPTQLADIQVDPNKINARALLLEGAHGEPAKFGERAWASLFICDEFSQYEESPPPSSAGCYMGRGAVGVRVHERVELTDDQKKYRDERAKRDLVETDKTKVIQNHAIIKVSRGYEPTRDNVSIPDHACFVTVFGISAMRTVGDTGGIIEFFNFDFVVPDVEEADKVSEDTFTFLSNILRGSPRTDPYIMRATDAPPSANNARRDLIDRLIREGKEAAGRGEQPREIAQVTRQMIEQEQLRQWAKGMDTDTQRFIESNALFLVSEDGVGSHGVQIDPPETALPPAVFLPIEEAQRLDRTAHAYEVTCKTECRVTVEDKKTIFRIGAELTMCQLQYGISADQRVAQGDGLGEPERMPEEADAADQFETEMERRRQTRPKVNVKHGKAVVTVGKFALGKIFNTTSQLRLLHLVPVHFPHLRAVVCASVDAIKTSGLMENNRPPRAGEAGSARYFSKHVWTNMPDYLERACVPVTEDYVNRVIALFREIPGRKSKPINLQTMKQKAFNDGKEPPPFVKQAIGPFADVLGTMYAPLDFQFGALLPVEIDAELRARIGAMSRDEAAAYCSAELNKREKGVFKIPEEKFGAQTIWGRDKWVQNAAPVAAPVAVAAPAAAASPASQDAAKRKAAPGDGQKGSSSKKPRT